MHSSSNSLSCRHCSSLVSRLSAMRTSLGCHTVYYRSYLPYERKLHLNSPTFVHSSSNSLSCRHCSSSVSRPSAMRTSSGCRTLYNRSYLPYERNLHLNSPTFVHSSSNSLSCRHCSSFVSRLSAMRTMQFRLSYNVIRVISLMRGIYTLIHWPWYTPLQTPWAADIVLAWSVDCRPGGPVYVVIQCYRSYLPYERNLHLNSLTFVHSSSNSLSCTLF